MQAGVTKKGSHQKRFLDWEFNILQLAIYFVNLPVLRDLYQEPSFFKQLVSEDANSNGLAEQGPSSEFLKVGHSPIVLS